jgi:DNA-binding XRE family transcriptional regulator
MTAMRPIRHDRSIIDAYGGNWSAVADGIRADMEAIAAGHSMPPPPYLAPNNLPLRQRREALGLTRRAFASFAGVSNTTADRLENGVKCRPRTMTLYRAALAKAEAENRSVR